MEVRERLFPVLGDIGLGLLALMWQHGLTTPRSWAGEREAGGGRHSQGAPLEPKVPAREPNSRSPPS